MHRPATWARFGSRSACYRACARPRTLWARPPLRGAPAIDLVVVVRFLDRRVLPWIRDALAPGGQVRETGAQLPRPWSAASGAPVCRRLLSEAPFVYKASEFIDMRAKANMQF